MTLLAMILALLGERFLGAVDEYRRLDPYDRYLSRLNAKAGRGIGREIVLIAAGVVLPAVLAQWAIHVLGEVFFLFEIAASAAVLLFCMGPRSFYESAKAFCNTHDEGNREGARWYLETLLGRILTDEELQQMPRTLADHLFVIAHERLFAVLFWFLILGPFGALAYSLLRHVRSSLAQPGLDGDSADLVPQLLHYITWPSARTLALLYAMAGNFVDGIAGFKGEGKERCVDWTCPNERTLVCTGRGAMSMSAEQRYDSASLVYGTLALIRRSIAFFVGAVALMTLSGLMT